MEGGLLHPRPKDRRKRRKGKKKRYEQAAREAELDAGVMLLGVMFLPIRRKTPFEKSVQKFQYIFLKTGISRQQTYMSKRPAPGRERIFLYCSIVYFFWN